MLKKYLSRTRFNRAQWAWLGIDFGNSAYATSIMAGFFPILFKNYYAQNLSSTESTSWLGLSLSLTSIFLATLNPLIGWFTDYRPWNKKGLLFFSALSWLGISGLIVAQKGQWTLALWSYGLSLVGFNLSMSLYDALLKHVTSPYEEHRLSSMGYALGYLGGGLLFGLQVLFIQSAARWGISDQVIAVKWCFASVIGWWALCSLPLFLWVKERPTREVIKTFQTSASLSEPPLQQSDYPRRFWRSGQYFFNDTKQLLSNKSISYFLLAYWLYIDVIYTVINMAADYATALGLKSEDLLKALLLVQILGFPATAFTGYLTKYLPAKRILIGLLLIYVVILAWSYFISSTWHFWVLACLIAIAQGGVQSLSRSVFAKLVNEQEVGYAFGLFNMVGRMASIAGPMILAGVTYSSSSHRLGMLSLLPLLLGGIWFLRLVKE